MAAAAATATSTSTSTTPAAGESSSSSPRTPNVNNHGVFSSPWAQVVKGAGDSPEISEQPPLSENLHAGDANVGKNSAWEKPVYQVSVSPPPQSLAPPSPSSGGGVMGAVSWPALSESARIKSSSSDRSKSTHVSLPLSQGSVTSHLPQSKSSSTTNQNSSMTNAAPTRQRSMKRGANKQGGFARGPPPPPAFPVPDFAQSSFTKGTGPGPDSSLRDSKPTAGIASHSNSTNEHSNHRSSNRRGNFGQIGRGDGRNHFHGGRRDQDHGSYDRNLSSSSHGRGAHGRPHRPHGRGFMGPSVQGTPPFAPPPPVRPYGNTLVYPDPALVYYIPSLPMDSFGGMPYFTGPPPPPYLVMSDPLRASIINQIEYYFSDANLVKDEFLRSKMDEQGWVPITLIASFRRVQNLTSNVSFIIDCLKGSTIVEVQGDKVRRSNDWLKWLTHQQSTSDSGVQSSVDYDKLTSSIQRVSLEENQGNASSALMEKMANNLGVSNVEGSVQHVC